MNANSRASGFLREIRGFVQRDGWMTVAGFSDVAKNADKTVA
jgi:hypothetical protein